MPKDIRSFINQVLREHPGDILVVDDDIDVFNDAEVLWAIGTRCSLEKDLALIPRLSISSDQQHRTLTCQIKPDSSRESSNNQVI